MARFLKKIKLRDECNLVKYKYEGHTDEECYWMREDEWQLYLAIEDMLQSSNVPYDKIYNILELQRDVTIENLREED
jgi:hypothetical protein